MSGLYDLTKSYEENVTYGAHLDLSGKKLSTGKSKGPKPVFGVAACPLTVNARAISILSNLGFDILTYKSVRSREWHGNAFPHWVNVDAPVQLTHVGPQTFVGSFESVPGQDVTMANSFGIHSVSPQYWQQDFEVAQTFLKPGQLLILSLMATPTEGQTLEDDAKELGRLANQTSAKVCELNLACPNTDGGKGLIYEDLEMSVRLLKAVKKQIGKKKLLVKVGYYQDQSEIKKFLKMAKGVIDGISSTNTYSMKITDADGKDIFPGRPMAGISGAAIRNLSMQQAAAIVKARQELDLGDFVIIGIGGVTKPEHITQYLKLGVDAVQCAVGAWADPELALKYKKIAK